MKNIISVGCKIGTWWIGYQYVDMLRGKYIQPKIDKIDNFLRLELQKY